jgi:hypothetical protein
MSRATPPGGKRRTDPALEADDVEQVDGFVLEIAAGIDLVDARSQDRGEPFDLVAVARAVSSFDRIAEQHLVAWVGSKASDGGGLGRSEPPGVEFDTSEDVGGVHDLCRHLGDQRFGPFVSVVRDTFERSSSDEVEGPAQFRGIDLFRAEARRARKRKSSQSVRMAGSRR